MIGHSDFKNLVSESGVNYQIEFNVFWDSKPEEDLRIVGSIDDVDLKSLAVLALQKPLGISDRL